MPRILVVLLFVFSFILLGCSGWERNPTREYTVWVDNTFSQEQQAWIYQGSLNWERSVGEYIQFKNIGSTLYDDEATIKIHASNREELAKTFGAMANSKMHRIGYCSYEGVGSSIQLDINLKDNDFKWVVQHELGHALGLKHTGPHTLMCPDTECSGPSPITSEDLHQFQEVWGH